MSNQQDKTSAPPEIGDRAECRSCHAEIVYIGPYWDHVGPIKPRHPGFPVEQKSTAPDALEMQARQIDLGGPCECATILDGICGRHARIVSALRQAHAAGAREAGERACEIVCALCAHPEYWQPAQFDITVYAGPEFWHHLPQPNYKTEWHARECHAARIRAALSLPAKESG